MGIIYDSSIKLQMYLIIKARCDFPVILFHYLTLPFDLREFLGEKFVCIEDGCFGAEELVSVN